LLAGFTTVFRVTSIRPSVPAATKRALVREAGGKCANPGCPNQITDLHHIRRWAVYRTHDAAHMIAVCPTCHAHVERGELTIDDEALYEWKQLQRNAQADRDYLYVEPGDTAKLLLGSIAVQGDRGLAVFELGATNKLSFVVKDRDLLLVSLTISTREGDEVLRVVDNHVRLPAVEGVYYSRRPGRIRVTGPAEERFLPGWALYRVQLVEPGYAADQSLTLLELEVLEPGLVRVQGIWTEGPRAVVITGDAFHHVTGSRRRPLTIKGEGADSGLVYTGPITTALFGV